MAGRRRVAVLWMVQGLGEPRHLAPVDVPDVEVDVREVGRRGRNPFGEFILARFQLTQPVHHAPDLAAVLDDCDHGGSFLIDVSQLLAVARARDAALPVDPVGLLGIGRYWASPTGTGP